MRDAWPAVTVSVSALPDWRSRQGGRFHRYSPPFFETVPDEIVDQLCEDAVSGTERLVALTIAGRATAEALP